jgi:hypothetical protein
MYGLFGSVMGVLFFYILFVGLIGIWARKLNRNVVLCVLGAIVFSPLIVGIYLLYIDTSNNGVISSLFGNSEPYDTCPKCAEKVKRDAIACKHCGNELLKKCNKCAETIKLEAKICKHCGSETQKVLT